jgi:hypothetical protein
MFNSINVHIPYFKNHSKGIKALISDYLQYLKTIWKVIAHSTGHVLDSSGSFGNRPRLRLLGDEPGPTTQTIEAEIAAPVADCALSAKDRQMTSGL